MKKVFLLSSYCYLSALREACDQAFLCSRKREEYLMAGYFVWKGALTTQLV